MNTELTEEEMRRALFGGAESPAPVSAPAAPDPVPQIVIEPPVKTVVKKKIAKAFTPRLRVTLRVGNEFEGQMHEIVPGRSIALASGTKVQFGSTEGEIRL